VPVRFAGLVLNLDACTLARDRGDAIRLTRGEFALLRMFVTRPGRVISRDALLDAFTNRRFEPFDRSIDVLVGRLRRKIEADPKRPRLIVTVPGGGYRFDGLTQCLSSQQKPSIVVHASQDDDVSPDMDLGSDSRLADQPPAFDAASGAKAPMSERGEPPRLSIVVLPFANIGGDPEQDYFADGLTESLTTDLSRISGAFVISCNTALTYKGQRIDATKLGRELNVRYVLEGSVQRGGGRVRVNAQLVEAETGAHLWAERFDKRVADLFDMQDEIVSRLANQLGQELLSAEARQAERSPHPDSMDLYFLGLAAYNRGPIAANLNPARAYFDRALEVDPANIDALILRGSVDLAYALNWSTDDPLSRLRAAEADFVKALRLRPDDARAHTHFGAVCAVTKRADRGVSECERALAIDRNCVWAHVHIGMTKYVLGRNDETEAHIREALRLSPHDSRSGAWFGIVGFAQLGAGRDEDSIRWFSQSIEANPNLPMSHFLFAAASARLGRMEGAQDALRAGLELNPSFTIGRFKSQTFSDNPVYLAGRERMYEGLRKAGVPEG
jgi:TolB-like protein/DNA-binding winged helix-turn-helix (wHTH) protein/Tfp pilus assembly protein PilF